MGNSSEERAATRWRASDERAIRDYMSACEQAVGGLGSMPLQERTSGGIPSFEPNDAQLRSAAEYRRVDAIRRAMIADMGIANWEVLGRVYRLETPPRPRFEPIEDAEGDLHPHPHTLPKGSEGACEPSCGCIDALLPEIARWRAEVGAMHIAALAPFTAAAIERGRDLAARALNQDAGEKRLLGWKPWQSDTRPSPELVARHAAACVGRSALSPHASKAERRAHMEFKETVALQAQAMLEDAKAGWCIARDRLREEQKAELDRMAPKNMAAVAKAARTRRDEILDEALSVISEALALQATGAIFEAAE